MNKKDLKNGMIVELRNGTRYLYCEGVIRGLDEWNVISNYTDTLNNTAFPHLDIVKVYEDPKMYNLNRIFKHQYLKLIWQRPEPPKLSKKEIEILKALDVIGFKYIARDKSGNIFAYQSEPIKDLEVEIWLFDGTVNFDEIQIFKLKRDLFSFVDWKDKEPTSIKKLLEQVKEKEK